MHSDLVELVSAWPLAGRALVDARPGTGLAMVEALLERSRWWRCAGLLAAALPARPVRPLEVPILVAVPRGWLPERFAALPRHWAVLASDDDDAVLDTALLLAREGMPVRAAVRAARALSL